MTQSDLFLSNQPGASFRSELNTIIEALATNSAGTVDPAPTFPSQWFADWNANLMRRRRKDNTAWIDVAPIDAAFIQASVAEILAGTEATKGLTASRLATIWKRGANIASAAALDVSGAGYFFHVTGAVAITSLTGRNDGPPLLLMFEAACVVTNGANLILPGGVNFNAAIGDAMLLVNDGGAVWRCVATFKSAGAAAGVSASCRFDYVSTAILRLNRYNGYLLTIDNAPQTIPAAGVDLAPTGFAGGSVYNVYAYMNAGAMALEGSLTTWATDPRNGLKIKNGDPTRTLVGKFYCAGGPAFVQSQTTLGVLSWFNRQTRHVYNSGSPGTGATAGVALLGAVYFLTWGEDKLALFVLGMSYSDTAGASIGTSLQVNGGAAGSTNVWAPFANTGGDCSFPNWFGAGETASGGALHQLIPWGAVNAGAAYWSMTFGVAVPG